MPEEVNRVVCDALADLLLAPGPAAAENLAREGVAGDVVVTGDVMGDVVLGLRESLDPDAVAAQFGVTANEFVLVTAHRAANVDDPAQLLKLVELLESLDLPSVFPLHPRTRSRLEAAGLLDRLESAPLVSLVASQPYTATIALAAAARAVLTDSGGLQKEAIWLGTQTLTMRPSTEWVETVESGWNSLVGLDPELVAAALSAGPPSGRPPELYGAGTAGAAVVNALEQWAAGVKSA
jgi:UDP-N-acetylglucosamine 2-epimerase